MLGIHQRGDTIIEVLLAITVFSLVSVGAIMIMNQGTNAAQRSLEVTLVKQQIDAQAEALRAAHTAQIVAKAGGQATTASWNTLTTASTPTQAVADNCPADIQPGLVMNGRTGTALKHTITNTNNSAGRPYARVVYDSTNTVTDVYGIWIERSVQTTPTLPKLYVFKIKGCWYGPGLDAPMQLQTIVRLYDPA